MAFTLQQRGGTRFASLAEAVKAAAPILVAIMVARIKREKAEREQA